MSTQSIIQQVRWQDLKVKREVDVVFEIAKKEGWNDCEIFGYGDMITQPQETTGWKLIPADLYEDSIPAEGIGRVHQIINAGVRIRGVIIADDERRVEASPTPSRLKVLPSVVAKIPSFFGRAKAGLSQAQVGLGSALTGMSRVPARFGKALVAGLGRWVSGLGRLLLKLFGIAIVVSIISLSAYLLIRFPLLLMIVPVFAAFAGMGTTAGTGVSYDPKLVILVDDGKGSTVWVSVLTWYD